MRPPFVSRAAYEALDARYQRVLAERDDARAGRDTERSAKQIAVRQIVLLSGQVGERDARIRELTARLADRDVPADVTALKQQLDDAEAHCARLQTNLDHALGLDDPKVEDGKGWQARREQKMRYDK